jgi:hypothetical protein
MIGQCIQRSNALELTLRSIINNTEFTNSSGKTLANELLKISSDHTTSLLKLLNKSNTKA